jgi:hypothetical protein
VKWRDEARGDECPNLRRLHGENFLLDDFQFAAGIDPRLGFPFVVTEAGDLEETWNCPLPAGTHVQKIALIEEMTIASLLEE